MLLNWNVFVLTKSVVSTIGFRVEQPELRLSFPISVISTNLWKKLPYFQRYFRQIM